MLRRAKGAAAAAVVIGSLVATLAVAGAASAETPASPDGVRITGSGAVEAPSDRDA